MGKTWQIEYEFIAFMDGFFYKKSKIAYHLTTFS